jgi:hypothetical protein
MNDGSFHQAISRVLLMGTFLGLPICGIQSSEISNLRFTWKSFRAIYSFYLLVMSIFFLICHICWMVKLGDLNLSNFVVLATRVRNVICLILFQKLAKEWPSLIRKWKYVEDSLTLINYTHKRNFLRYRIFLIQVFITSMSVGQ